MGHNINPSILFIGAGQITHSHIKAAEAVGFTLAGLSNYQQNLQTDKLTSEFEFNHKKLIDIDDVTNFDFSALSILTNTENHLRIYSKFKDLNVPILIEKPVSLNSTELSYFKPFKQNVLVGYNRRHYSSIKKLRKELQLEEIYTADILISESAWGFNFSKREYERTLLENSVHILDLIFYLFGDIIFFNIKREQNKNFVSIMCQFKNNLNLLGSLKILFGVPTNSYIRIFAPNKVFELIPIENLCIYDGMEMISASAKNPIKVYKPTSSTKFILDKSDAEFKPGFVSQYREFRELVDGKVPQISADLNDALIVLKAAEDIIGV